MSLQIVLSGVRNTFLRSMQQRHIPVVGFKRIEVIHALYGAQISHFSRGYATNPSLPPEEPNLGPLPKLIKNHKRKLLLGGVVTAILADAISGNRLNIVPKDFFKNIKGVDVSTTTHNENKAGRDINKANRDINIYGPTDNVMEPSKKKE